MILADIIMMDNTTLNQVRLFKSRDLGDSEVSSKEEADKLLDFESERILYFSGKYVQGGFITKQIMEYQLIDDSETQEEKIKSFVKNISTVLDTNDTAEFIIEHKVKLLELLR